MFQFVRFEPGGSPEAARLLYWETPEKTEMSQRDVEKLLGKILTDDEFRQSFFPVGRRSFEFAAEYGLELTPIERSALSSLKSRAFECLARSLDPRISRSSAAGETIAAHDEGGF